MGQPALVHLARVPDDCLARRSALPERHNTFIFVLACRGSNVCCSWSLGDWEVRLLSFFGFFFDLLLMHTYTGLAHPRPSFTWRHMTVLVCKSVTGTCNLLVRVALQREANSMSEPFFFFWPVCSHMHSQSKCLSLWMKMFCQLVSFF